MVFWTDAAFLALRFFCLRLVGAVSEGTASAAIVGAVVVAVVVAVCTAVSGAINLAAVVVVVVGVATRATFVEVVAVVVAGRASLVVRTILVVVLLSLFFLPPAPSPEVATAILSPTSTFYETTLQLC